MGAVATVASVLLGATFVLAGAAKLAARSDWRAQARELGAPTSIAPFVPWIELLVGAALTSQLLEPVPAVVAIVLLAAFTALIGARLAEGRRPVCACFGAWSARPIGAGQLVRNAVLLVLGVLSLLA